jgi:hypothetical protein
MSAQIVLGKAIYTIRGADHLQVEGGLVRIQRSSPTGFETVAVAGEDMLVTIEPAECSRERLREPENGEVGTLHWHPVGSPLD